MMRTRLAKTWESARASWPAFAQQYSVLVMIVFFTLLLRLALAGRNSYWLDELYSVEQYVVIQDSLFDALRSLAAGSIHPPLYQTVLYGWVELFGSTETATRTLSSIFVAVSVVFVHRTVALFFDRRLADIAALLYALLGSATQYGLESRSYGMSLMLAAGSTMALARWLRRVEQSSPPPRRIWLPGKDLFWLSFFNLALLMTHYYNFFFWAAQGAFLLIYLARTWPARQRVRHVLHAIAFHVVQLLVFVAVWGYVIARSYRMNQGRFEVDQEMGPVFTPVEMLRTIVAANFSFFGLPALVVLLIITCAVVVTAVILPRVQDRPGGRLLLLQLAVLVVVPFLVAFGMFMIAGAERFKVQYMLYVLPALTILIAVAFRYLWMAIGMTTGTRHSVNTNLKRARSKGPGIIAVIALAGILVVPGTVKAASQKKQDWRGMVQQVIDIVHADPEHTYYVVETGFRSLPVSNHYFRRFDPEVRAQEVLRRVHERRGDFGLDEELLGQYDYVIVMLPHLGAGDFPGGMQILNSRYEVVYSDVDSGEHGILIFSTQ